MQKVMSCSESRATKGFLFNAWSVSNRPIAFHASPNARAFVFLNVAFSVHLTSFPTILFQCKVTHKMNGESDFNSQFKKKKKIVIGQLVEQRTRGRKAEFESRQKGRDNFFHLS